MKVVIFGGSGFIGSHVAEALVEAGHEVTIFDLKPPPQELASLAYVQGSTLDRELVARTIQGQGAVYNFAGIAHLDIGLNHPIETVEQNVLATVLSLEAARQAGVERYVYASSIYVYSQSGSFYRCSKQAAELYIEEYQRLHGLGYTILRFGTIYGPRADQYNSVRKVLAQALFDRRIVVKGSGDEIREYVHVRDAARSSAAILSEEFRNEMVVLTGHHPMRYRDMLATVREIVGEDVEISLSEPPSEDIRHGRSGHYRLTPYHFAPKIAKKLVNNPYLDLGQGLLECLRELYEAHHSAAD